MKIALTNRVTDGFEKCALTYREREPIDVNRARAQHEAYCRLLESLGLKVVRLEVNRDFPDAVFVEDTAVTAGDLAVMTAPGADSRLGEVEAMADVLSGYLRVARIRPPARIDGGDVLIVGRRVFVGLSSRTNENGAKALAGHLAPLGYTVTPVKMQKALHLKSAVTALDDETLIIHREALPASSFAGFRLVDVPPEEPGAANVLRIGDRIVIHAGYRRTAALLGSLGYETAEVDVSELIKAESGVTCSSIIFDHDD